VSRAAGGASAVGCGVFGLGGLLVGVALVVWLGSQALSGTTGGSDDGSRLFPSVPATLAATGEPAGAELAITPDADLGATGQVSVAGTGFAPGAIELTVCLAARLEGQVACSDDGGTAATVTEQGTFDRALEVGRVLVVEDTPYDCAVRPGACVLRTHRVDGPPDRGLAGPLAFATGLPPVEAAPAPG
jgi:hypothetical protein